MRPSPPPVSPTHACFRRGVEIYRISADQAAHEAAIVDDVVHIGSSNFDIRSLYLNMELMLRVDDADVRRD